ncbi:nucleotidyltransferase family protein [Cohnella sp. REN36]|uniref:nucleotidyltransferase family protein n=1 Tax=Cohnella sp. REN36 TaxID=2887347 RepID=UPI001D146B3D|nr:nucleotidyltransferase family protein [Cohnella sp. REN36]MCC3373809.1 nucleotidyltransferase family protein [Cohnella sp. REN36]
MSLKSLVESKQDTILRIAQINGVKKISVFGSVAKEEDHEHSDIDFLVEFEDHRTLFDLIRLKHDLEALLNRSVDVVTENAVHWKLKDQILHEAIQL